MPLNNICTFEELKEATKDFKDLTIDNISEFIEEKSNQQYSIYETRMILEFTENISSNITSINCYMTATNPLIKKWSPKINKLLDKTIAIDEFENSNISKH